MTIRHNPTCSAATRKGGQCGRKVKDGSQPPICSVHRQKAQGIPPPFAAKSFTQRKPVDPIAIIEQLMRSNDESVRLKAADLYLDLMKHQQVKPSSQTTEAEEVLRRASPEQLEEIRFHAKAVQLLKRQVLGLPDPEVHVTAATVSPSSGTSEDPSGSGTSDSCAPDTAAVETPVGTDGSSETPQSAKRPLHPALYEDCGLFTMGDPPRWGHPLGDDVASRIIDGTITYAEARAAWAKRQQSMDRMSVSEPKIFDKENS